ncbi:MAG: hypothetical protein ACLUIX_03145 [Oscillospiraceae bacterium]
MAIREKAPRAGQSSPCASRKTCSSVELSHRMEELAVAGKTR